MPIPPPPPAPPPVIAGSERPTPRTFFAPSPDFGRRVVFVLAAMAVSSLVGLVVAYLPILLAVGGLLALVMGVAILRFPYVGLLFYLVLFILRPGEVYPILAVLRLERVVGVLTLISLAFREYQTHGGLVPDSTKQTKAALFFILAVLFSIPFSYWRGESITTFMDVMKAFGLYVMTLHLIDTRRKLHGFIWLYMICVLYLNASSLIHYYTGSAAFAQGIDRATGSTSAAGNANELGTTLACTFPLYLLFALGETSRWRRFLAGGLGLAGIWGMILTGSRASLLGFLGGLVYLWWRSKRRVVLAFTGILVLAAGFALIPAQYKGRYETITQANLDESSRARVATWITGAQMIMDRPLFGVGAGCFGVARATHYSPENRRIWLNSHSLYIQVLTELGLVGATAFFAFVLQFLRLNRRVAAMLPALQPKWKIERSLNDALLAGFIVLLISGIFGHSLYRRTWYLYAGLGVALYRMLRKGRGEIPAGNLTPGPAA